MVGLLRRVISPSQGLYLHRTTQHRKTRTNIHALSGIRTHDPSNQPAKTHTSNRTATVTGIFSRIPGKNNLCSVVICGMIAYLYSNKFVKIAVFWVVAPCSLVEVFQRFSGPCCLHYQGVESSETLVNFYQATRRYNP
jgi:hypothetical protein